MLERDIERRVCQYADKKGWLSFKFTSPANRGVPDRLLINNGRVIFIEFKQKGKKPTPLQDRIINKIRQHAGEVYVVDDLDEGKRLIDELST